MEAPGKILYVPVYCKAAHHVASTKLGLIRAPSEAKLDTDDVFDGRRPCQLDYILCDADAGDDEVTRVAFMAKKSVTSTVDGWECEYHRKCKVADLISPRRESVSMPCEVESPTCTQTGHEATPTLGRSPTFSLRLVTMTPPNQVKDHAMRVVIHGARSTNRNKNPTNWPLNPGSGRSISK